MKRKTTMTRLNSFLLLAAVALLLFAGIGSARSALVKSDKYETQIATKNIDLTINENGKAVGEDGALLKSLLKDGETLKVGQMYPESLTVTNTGDIDQYVRVTIYTFWTDADGKRVDLDPDLIKTVLGSDKDWVVSKSDSTKERTVLYYTKPLKPGETTSDVITKVGLDQKVAKLITQEPVPQESGADDEDAAYTDITTTYDYNGVQFGIRADADGIQTHSAEKAIRSAWGVEVKIDNDGNLSI